jgi:hypothetical protein
MPECKVCKTTETIVHSGVDALLLGIVGAETGTMCYSCANQARNAKLEKEEKTDGTL